MSVGLAAEFVHESPHQEHAAAADAQLGGVEVRHGLEVERLALVDEADLDAVGQQPALDLDGAFGVALVGVALTAMLMGHSYLIAPAMSLAPLRRLLVGLFVTLGLRLGFAAGGLRVWTAGTSADTLKEAALLWLPLRWGLGFVLPLVLGVMAWHTARLRNTQSATGILYIVVVFCFLGELTAQLLFQVTHYFL